MVKYKQYFQEMMEFNKDLFDKFKDVHDKYVTEPEKYQKEFNEVGQTITEVIRRYENRLCSKSEGSGFGKYSSNLSDKFWAEIRVHFPKIDYIGLQ